MTTLTIGALTINLSSIEFYDKSEVLETSILELNGVKGAKLQVTSPHNSPNAVYISELWYNIVAQLRANKHINLTAILQNLERIAQHEAQHSQNGKSTLIVRNRLKAPTEPINVTNKAIIYTKLDKDLHRFDFVDAPLRCTGKVLKLRDGYELDIYLVNQGGKLSIPTPHLRLKLTKELDSSQIDFYQRSLLSHFDNALSRGTQTGVLNLNEMLQNLVMGSPQGLVVASEVRNFEPDEHIGY